MRRNIGEPWKLETPAARRIHQWKHAYSKKHGVPLELLENWGDDVAHTMMELVRRGRTPKEAYDAVTDGLYFEDVRTLPAQVVSNRRRTSRRRTSRR